VSRLISAAVVVGEQRTVSSNAAFNFHFKAVKKTRENSDEMNYEAMKFFARWLSRVNVLIYNSLLFPPLPTECLVYIQIFTEFSRIGFRRFWAKNDNRSCSHTKLVVTSPRV
jgi:hypothetical protein